ncbi:54S ribosomal protein L6 [Drechslerella dactyloides]|uniref:54S ribosomal protein L6 n=1 Tax=Drechslerella dactyloides TaxID=74499 RepID=A0AAD6J0C4_DREDA|nr:54S ribosomal protein L6 [Drechslerella dactyloides]
MSTSLHSRLARLALSPPSICRRCLAQRSFSSTIPKASKVGSAPLILPPGVTLSIYTPPPFKHVSRHPRIRTATIAGPLGQVTIPIPPYLSIKHVPAAADAEIKSSKAFVTVERSEIRNQRMMWGTIRALLASNITGVTEGHAAIVRFVGVGYRAIVEEGSGRFLTGRTVVNLKLGYSHPILMPVPDGVTASSPVPTRLLIEGVDKQRVTQFAAKIRNWRVPEPYKGKGIFVNDETIKLKAKKIK